MSFSRSIRFRWWAFRQMVFEFSICRSWDEVLMVLQDEFWLSAVLGHVNISDLAVMEDEYEDLWNPLFVSMNRLMEIVDDRLNKAEAMGLKEWGSYPAYLRLQKAHLKVCMSCRERLFAEVRESVRLRVELEPFFRAIRKERAENH